MYPARVGRLAQPSHHTGGRRAWPSPSLSGDPSSCGAAGGREPLAMRSESGLWGSGSLQGSSLHIPVGLAFPARVAGPPGAAPSSILQ